MTDRLTRAQRKKIESETHQKLDLDHLAEINVQDLIEEAEHKEPASVEVVIEPTKEESSELSEEEESSEEEDSDSEASSDDDVDLDDLLNKAQKAIESQSADILLESDDKPANKLSKMDTGISTHHALYLKKSNGRTKLVPDAVTLVDEDTKPTSKATVVLKESKSVTQPLTKKERQAVRNNNLQEQT
jgi:hypothetical protein